MLGEGCDSLPSLCLDHLHVVEWSLPHTVTMSCTDKVFILTSPVRDIGVVEEGSIEGELSANAVQLVRANTDAERCLTIEVT